MVSTADNHVVAWSVSNTLDTASCLEALEQALAQARPEIFNTVQGHQFTSEAFTGMLNANGSVRTRPKQVYVLSRDRES